MTETPVHATFENAWRLAATMAEARNQDFAVVRTNDPARPFVVDDDLGHRDVVAVIKAACASQRLAGARSGGGRNTRPCASGKRSPGRQVMCVTPGVRISAASASS